LKDLVGTENHWKALGLFVAGMMSSTVHAFFSVTV
jgi:hypothetical protein